MDPTLNPNAYYGAGSANPYVTVGSPSYAGPLLSFSALNRYAPQRQQQTQNQNPQANAANQFGNGIRNWWQGLQPYLSGNQPQSYQPNGPLMIAPQLGATYAPGASGGAIY